MRGHCVAQGIKLPLSFGKTESVWEELEAEKVKSASEFQCTYGALRDRHARELKALQTHAEDLDWFLPQPANSVDSSKDIGQAPRTPKAPNTHPLGRCPCA